jgi:antitoxin component YwqK of YwqJK toxin-antitoxin module
MIKDSHNNDMIFRERYYDDGTIKAQYWVDDDLTFHDKKYFPDGQLRSYKTSRKREDGSVDYIHNYNMCFDENREQTLMEGNGIFYDYDFKEDNSSLFFYSIINCKNHLANGEYIGYINGKLSYRTTYVNGLEHGLHTQLDEQGNKKSIREFENGWYVQRHHC